MWKIGLRTCLVFCVLGGMGMCGFSGEAIARPDAVEKNFWQQIELRRCSRANSVYRSRLRSHSSRKLVFLKALRSCYRSTVKRHPHYYLHAIYLEMLRSRLSLPSALEVEARLYVARFSDRRISVHSYYKGANFRQLERQLKALQQLASVISSDTGLYAKYLYLVMRHAFRTRKDRLSYEWAATLTHRKYPEKWRFEAYKFLTRTLYTRYRPAGVPADPNRRLLYGYRKAYRALRSPEYRAECEYQILVLLLQQHSTKNATPPRSLMRRLQKLAQQKHIPKWSKFAQQLYDRYTRPGVTVQGTTQIKPSEQGAYSIGFVRIQRVQLRLYRADLQSVFLKRKKLFDVKNLQPGKLVWRRVVSLKQVPPGFWQGQFDIAREVKLPKLGPGTYLVEVSGENKFQRKVSVRLPLLVSHAAVVVKVHGKQALLMVADGRNHRPQVNVKVWLGVGTARAVRSDYHFSRHYTYRYPYRRRSYRGYRYYKRHRRHYRRYRRRHSRLGPYYYRRYHSIFQYNMQSRRAGQTDRDGLVRFRFTKPLQRRQLYAMACTKQSCTMSRAEVSHYHSGVTESLFWSTDRGAYRPGQTVRFKGILHVEERPASLPKQGRRVQVTVWSARNKRIFQKDFYLNAFGSFHGTWALPKTASLGSYRAVISTYRKNGRYAYRSHTRMFRVEEYRRPKFLVSATLLPGRFLAGDTLRWKIRANYTFGGPVKRGVVRWRLERVRVYPRFHFPQPYAWLLGNVSTTHGFSSLASIEQTRLQQQRNLQSYRRSLRQYKRICRRYRKRYPGRRYQHYYCRYANTYRGHIKRLLEQMKPMAEGKGVLNHKGELVVKTLSKPDSHYYQYFLIADVSDDSFQTVQGHGATVLGPQEAFAFVRLSQQIVQPGERAVVHLTTLRPNGRGVSMRGEVVLRRLTRAGQKGQIVRRFQVRTNRAGLATLRFSADYLGYFQLTFSLKSKSKHPIAATTALWLGGKKLKDSGYAYRTLEAVSDRKVYQPGDVMSLLVNSAKVPHSYLVTVEGKELLDVRVVRAQGRSTMLRIPIRDSFAPNVWVVVSHFHNHKWFQTPIKIAVPPVERLLKLRISKVKRHYRPGEKVRWTLQAVDGKGRPVQTEFLLLAYDQSLDTIGAMKWPDVAKTFIKPRRRNLVRTTGGQWLPMAYKRFGATSYRRISYKEALRWIRARRRYRKQIAKNRRGLRYRRQRGGAGGYGRSGSYRRGYGVPQARPSAPSAIPRSGRPSREPLAKVPSRRSYRPSAVAPSKQNDDDAANVLSGARRVASVATQPPMLPVWKRPRVRKDFRETAVWLAQVKTDRRGKARVSFRWPEALTTWSIRAVAVGLNAEVGSIQMVTQTRKSLMVRLATPRFFMKEDLSEIAVLAYNRGKSRRVRVRLHCKGATLLGSSTRRGSLRNGANGRWVFKVRAHKVGSVTFRAEVTSADEADAMQVERKVEAFGVEQQLFWAGSLRGGKSRAIPVQLPRRLVTGSGKLELILTSSLSRTVFEGLGYLVQFPYGCVEQTMSRFLPASLVARALAGLDKSNPGLARRLPLVLKAGLSRLYAFQHRDGGWGWWKHDRTNHFMTAYVLFGLSMAKRAGIPVRSDVLQRAAAYLRSQMVTLRRQPALHAYALYSLSLVGQLPPAEIDYSLRHLTKLNAYGLALLALAYHSKGDKPTTRHVLKKLHERLVRSSNGLAYVRGRGTLRGWSQDGLEATAVTLRAFVQVGTYKDRWPEMARWLLGQRRAGRWRSTRDTAQAILGLSAFATAMGDQHKGDRKLELWLDGRRLHRYTLNAADPVRGGTRIVLKDTQLRGGEQVLKIRNVGQGPIYYSMQLKYRTEDTKIRAGGSGHLQIKRSYYRVSRVDGKTVLQPIGFGEQVKAGTEIEVRVEMKANQTLQYLLFADRKPAGLESVNVRSGRPKESWINHMELREDHVAFFVGYLPAQIKRVLRYRMRAERPGRYRTMPTFGTAMYAPKVKAHSDSFLFVVKP